MIKSIKILSFLLIIAFLLSTTIQGMDIRKFPNTVLFRLAPYLKLHELIRLAITCKILNKKSLEYHPANGSVIKINEMVIPKYIEVHVTIKYFYFFTCNLNKSFH